MKTVKQMMVLLAILTGAILPGPNFFAEGDQLSDVTVSFIADSSPTAPLDPTNPDNEVEGGTNMPGPLSIDYVPLLSFGLNGITGKVETYETTNKTPYIQITDKRGTGAGWNVKAKLSKLENKVANRELPAAAITFKGNTAISQGHNDNTAPTTRGFTLTAGGELADVASAQVNTGMGTWLNRWMTTNVANPTNENVTLQVNTAKALALAYEGKITWTLAVTP
ncbi:MAG: WxL domain-containing protein [Culicoidibacterales bacterium]